MVSPVRASVDAMSKPVIHDGRQCGCPNKVVCEDAEEAQRNRLPPTSYEERVTKHLLAKGAKAERQRIRRAQRDALNLLYVMFHKDDVTSPIKRIHRIIDSATRATRKKWRRM